MGLCRILLLSDVIFFESLKEVCLQEQFHLVEKIVGSISLRSFTRAKRAEEEWWQHKR